MYIHLGEEVKDGIFKIDYVFNTEDEINQFEQELNSDEEQEYIEVEDCEINENSCYDTNKNEIVALDEEVVEEEFECKIGDVNYKTLKEAIQVAENGAIIDGTVENSIISRSVVVSSGAKVTNSIILTETYISNDTVLDYCIVDKYSRILCVKELKGKKNNPIYVKQGDII